MTNSSDWARAPFTYTVLPPPVRCPFCGHAGRVIVRTMPRESDGSFSRRCICKSCSRRYVEVCELPESASDWQE